jgi:hypothetical protein
VRDKITPGLWYLKTDFEPGYTVVSVLPDAFRDNHLTVFLIGEDDSRELADFGPDQFIAPVPAPGAGR